MRVAASCQEAGGCWGAAGAAGGVALPPRILNITVPHVGHLPLIALRPFFIVSSTASAISFLALHLTQYPSAIESTCRLRSKRSDGHGDSLGMGGRGRQ